MKLHDPHSLLTESRTLLLQKHAAEPFRFGHKNDVDSYSSLDDILTSQDVDVVVEDGIRTRGASSWLKEAEDFWRREAKILKLMEDRHDEFRTADRNLELVLNEEFHYSSFALRGLYVRESDRKIIKLFPEEMATEYGGSRVDELLVSTLAHEAMHAYFDRPGHDQFPYDYFVEEPLAEFGMLLYLHEINSGFLDWALEDVASKKTCYRFGRNLYDQYSNGETGLRGYAENFRILMGKFTIPDTLHSESGNYVLPEDGFAWKDLFAVPPRYFLDEGSRTLGLDGDWTVRDFSNSLADILVDLGVPCCRRHGCRIANIYIGDNCKIPHNEDWMALFSGRNVIVSNCNKVLKSEGGIPIWIENGIPALSVFDRSEFFIIFRKRLMGLVDIDHNVVIPCKYRNIRIDENGFIMVMDENRNFGLCDKQGKVIIPTGFEKIKCEGDRYRAISDGVETIFDKEGKIII